jgi:hypothetical protein
LPHVTISAITTTDSSVSFHVSKIGVPVLVKIPYFPNWKATGASKPVEVTPNDMVVVPTSTTVTLNYTASTIDWIGRAGSLIGLGGLVALWRPTRVPEPAVPIAPRPSSSFDSGDRDSIGDDDDTGDGDGTDGESGFTFGTYRRDRSEPIAYREPQDD